ncbi:MAG: protein-L-isoaspartate(D-aspartate) O-methyltransferase [Helicobacteraceae bacterium]|jgi:protein-L-isoaspartate(D-aspartate) O-methyltransferase|nr:protein-L-isoaspartate(D-aspartate) O-methyltransferase [Helicobacteraceae bacterium]
MALNQAQAVFAAMIAEKLKLSKKTLNAFAEVDRTLFIPRGLERLTYLTDALPIGANQRLSSPLTVAKMTEALAADDADGALEIGCGSGYQAAILSRITRRVFTIERIERLALEAKARFKALNYSNISVRFDDGHSGWKTYAPFDRILLSCETDSIAPALIEQLAIGGVLVAPVNGKITRIVKRYNGALTKETLDDCSFVPMLGGVERDDR